MSDVVAARGTTTIYIPIWEYVKRNLHDGGLDKELRPRTSPAAWRATSCLQGPNRAHEVLAAWEARGWPRGEGATQRGAPVSAATSNASSPRTSILQRGTDRRRSLSSCRAGKLLYGHSEQSVETLGCGNVLNDAVVSVAGLQVYQELFLAHLGQFGNVVKCSYRQLSVQRDDAADVAPSALSPENNVAAALPDLCKS